MPLFRVEPVAWEAPEPGGFDGLLLTSANAVRHGGETLAQLRGLKAYCVGSTTAAVARDAGFDIAASGNAGIERLLRSIEPGRKLLHLAGADRTEVPPCQQDLTTLIVYRSVELPIPNSLGDAEGSVVLVHSSRAARRFAEVAQELDRSSIAIAAISPAAAAEAGEGWREVQAAESPDDLALLALARSMCNKAR